MFQKNTDLARKQAAHWAMVCVQVVLSVFWVFLILCQVYLEATSTKIIGAYSQVSGCGIATFLVKVGEM